MQDYFSSLIVFELKPSFVDYFQDKYNTGKNNTALNLNSALFTLLNMALFQCMNDFPKKNIYFSYNTMDLDAKYFKDQNSSQEPK